MRNNPHGRMGTYDDGPLRRMVGRSGAAGVHPWQAQADATAPRGVDVRKLYDWLGDEALNLLQEAADNEQAVSLSESAGPAFMAEAYIEVRRHMRRFDRSLPKEDVDNTF